MTVVAPNSDFSLLAKSRRQGKHISALALPFHLTTARPFRYQKCLPAQVAQSVEQRTENPRVDGSIPPLGTMNSKGSDLIGAFFISAFLSSSGPSGV